MKRLPLASRKILPALTETIDDLRTLGDLGYEGEADTITVAFNALLKMTFRALRNISLNPWRIGMIVAAALAILHFDHARTT